MSVSHRFARAFQRRASIVLPMSTIYSTIRVAPSVGSTFQGESGRRYRLISPLTSEKDRNPHVWKAVDDADETYQYIVKQPRSDDDEVLNFPAFEHELRMQRLFRNAPFIRQMVDYIPPCPSNDSTPRMVLQGFEKTLWDARLRRELSYAEIRWIMKDVLIGLWTIHREGFVYSDLKMENVVLNGFIDEQSGHVRSIIARLADCGLITKQSDKEISSISYRSPEVYFRKAWNASSDIWSWGIMYCHLLEAHVDIGQPGMYESGPGKTAEEIAESVRSAMVLDFDLHHCPYYQKDMECFKGITQTVSGQESWATRLLRNGVPADEVNFVFTVLNPDPTERWTAEEIIRSGFLDALGSGHACVV